MTRGSPVIGGSRQEAKVGGDRVKKGFFFIFIFLEGARRAREAWVPVAGAPPRTDRLRRPHRNACD